MAAASYQSVGRLLRGLSLVLIVTIPSVARAAQEPVSGRIDTFVTEAMHELQLVPGLALAVVQGDRVVHARGFGWRDVEQHKPVTPHTIFYTASLAKAFTGLTAAILAARGELDLDAPLRQFFSDLSTESPVRADRVTVRDLLRHGKRFTNGAVNFVTTFVGPYEDADLIRVLNRYSTATEGFRWGDLDAPAIPAGGHRFVVSWIPGVPPATFVFEAGDAGVLRFRWDSREFVRR